MRYEDGNYLKLTDGDLVFDVAYWQMHAENAVNFVGGTTQNEKTKQGGGGCDWVINGDGTVSAKHHQHLVLGLRLAEQPVAKAVETGGGGGGGASIEFLGLWRDTDDRAMPIKMNVNPGDPNQVS